MIGSFFFVDRKAFDAASHEFHSLNLEHYGAGGRNLSLHRSHMSDREEFFRLNAIDSKT